MNHFPGSGRFLRARMIWAMILQGLVCRTDAFVDLVTMHVRSRHGYVRGWTQVARSVWGSFDWLSVLWCHMTKCFEICVLRIQYLVRLLHNLSSKLEIDVNRKKNTCESINLKENNSFCIQTDELKSRMKCKHKANTTF